PCASPSVILRPTSVARSRLRPMPARTSALPSSSPDRLAKPPPRSRVLPLRPLRWALPEDADARRVPRRGPAFARAPRNRRLRPSEKACPFHRDPENPLYIGRGTADSLGGFHSASRSRNPGELHDRPPT